MSTDTVSAAGWRGHIVVSSEARGVIWEGHNLVVALAPEIMMAALMGSTRIESVAFGYGAGRVISPSTRSIPGVIARVNATTKTIGRAVNGRRTLGTWRFVWTPTAAATYDTLGLLASTGQLFAAANTLPSVELAADEAVAVAWTIYLRD